MPITIGALSKAAGVKVPTIRFYESIGLLPAPPRTESNRRTYGKQEIQRLSFIRCARELGFEITDIRALLEMAATPQMPCHDAETIARRHLAEIERRIDQLTALKVELSRMVTECSGGRVCDCRVIEVLANDKRVRGDQTSGA